MGAVYSFQAGEEDEDGSVGDEFDFLGSGGGFAEPEAVGGVDDGRVNIRRIDWLECG